MVDAHLFEELTRVDGKRQPPKSVNAGHGIERQPPSTAVVNLNPAASTAVPPLGGRVAVDG